MNPGAPAMCNQMVALFRFAFAYFGCGTIRMYGRGSFQPSG